MGSSISQKPDANEINGVVTVVSLLFAMALMAHQAVSTGHGAKGDPAHDNHKQRITFHYLADIIHCFKN